ncbi:MAG: 2-isopropylmalate synthase [Bacillota bacterium]|uniref:2-isopropylmalate synthase n=1 Tax=Thermanaerosceptrum fracticalcis TaxID=1712410 RepID=A0A7G6E3H9_THEFR|nr:2-isopropylmalate synthase [Thermanaerosceptrum fracticalcis]QNB46633.1 2-isopropylmalate synthase [Thermanaerosceptrum fracticalcis]
MGEAEKRIYIFDTTLRDGEQSPGVSLNLEEKLAIAHQLARLGVDIIEAGFPIASPGDFESVKRIANEVRGPIIAGLARTNREDIMAAFEAVKGAERPRIHTFVATSDIHMKHKLRKTKAEVKEMAVAGVKLAKSLVEDVEFSAEDAFRSDIPFLCEVFTAAIEAGANVINIPDTVGYATPWEFGEFVKAIRQGVPNIEKAIISVHCHNDLGLAVANSLAAIRNGAQQVEVAVNGIGERAGNASLEEVVMALYTRRNYLGFTTGINTREIYRTSRMVSTLTGMLIQPNKAIVGRNAFAHESGIHQDGVIKERETYEIMNPELVGISSNKLVLGKHSGRHALKLQLQELGYDLEGEALDKAFREFKQLADRKKEILDEDLIALVDSQVVGSGEEIYKLANLQVSIGTNISPTATVGLEIEGRLVEEAACADGPVEATYRAIDKIVKLPVRLDSYSISAVTGGTDAQGEVVVRVEIGDRTFMGRGLSVDIIEASARAYINALNKIAATYKEMVALPAVNE